MRREESEKERRWWLGDVIEWVWWNERGLNTADLHVLARTCRALRTWVRSTSSVTTGRRRTSTTKTRSEDVMERLVRSTPRGGFVKYLRHFAPCWTLYRMPQLLRWIGRTGRDDVWVWMVEHVVDAETARWMRLDPFDMLCEAAREGNTVFLDRFFSVARVSPRTDTWRRNHVRDARLFATWIRLRPEMMTTPTRRWIEAQL